MALSFNPQELPVVSTDSHLASVPSSSLHPEALRARFAKPPAWRPEIVT